MEIYEIKQPDLEIEDDLSPYADQWVATRDGRLVTSNRDFGRLRANPAVRPTDLFIPVSAHPRRICLY